MNFKEEHSYIWDSLAYFDEKISNKPLPEKVEELERTSLVNALTEFKGNKTKAAASLGIGRTNLIAKIKKYNLL